MNWWVAWYSDFELWHWPTLSIESAVMLQETLDLELPVSDGLVHAIVARWAVPWLGTCDLWYTLMIFDGTSPAHIWYVPWKTLALEGFQQELPSGISILCLFFLAQVVIDISISDWHLTSKEIYAGNSLQAIVGLLCELEQQTITQLKNERRRLPLKNKHQWMNETRKLWFTEWPEKVLTIGSQ